MTDPLVGIAVAKSVSEAGAEADTEHVARGLLIRVLGSSADAISEALGRYTAYRVRNVQAIVEHADAKSRDISGTRKVVNPRVAHVLLEDGSYCDDELMADYLGGVLAGSRTQHGRDDRAVAWSNVIISLSALQVRAHYLLYREWAARLRDIDDFNLGMSQGRYEATMDIELSEFLPILTQNSEVPAQDALGHSIPGLIRVGLLEDDYSIGPRENAGEPDPQFDHLLRVRPSVMGLELYGWAQGLPGLSPGDFQAKAAVFELADAIPRLDSAMLPSLPEARPTA
jgi:hypothetical protein